MPRTLKVGVIGTGTISSAYFRLAKNFKDIEIVACADLNAAAAEAKAKEFGIKAMTVDALLKDKSIEIIVNLTIPAAHFAVTKQCLDAGKHVYSEKPFVLSMKEGEAIRKLAEKKGLQVASAPDTFLGGAHQTARKLIDDGKVGKILSGACYVAGFGMEHWHPQPDFYFKPGGGPILDMGPYYLHNLINLIGPVTRVGALSGTGKPIRTISSQPRAGQTIKVETPTSYLALLEFASGAQVTLSASWDVWAHRHANMELYGLEGSLYVPDPNFFGGDLQMTTRDGDPVSVDQGGHPLGVINENHGPGRDFANFRTAGIADMAIGIRDGRDVRCSMERALHAVDIMTAIMKSGESKKFVSLSTTCTRPAHLGVKEAKGMMRA
jgi:predicted dehydrogenase